MKAYICRVKFFFNSTTIQQKFALHLYAFIYFGVVLIPNSRYSRNECAVLEVSSSLLSA